jgi:hypothetical protein
MPSLLFLVLVVVMMRACLNPEECGNHRKSLPASMIDSLDISCSAGLLGLPLEPPRTRRIIFYKGDRLPHENRQHAGLGKGIL